MKCILEGWKRLLGYTFLLGTDPNSRMGLGSVPLTFNASFSCLTWESALASVVAGVRPIRQNSISTSFLACFSICLALFILNRNQGLTPYICKISIFSKLNSQSEKELQIICAFFYKKSFIPEK